MPMAGAVSPQAKLELSPAKNQKWQRNDDSELGVFDLGREKSPILKRRRIIAFIQEGELD